MNLFFECKNCGDHIPSSKIEEHVKEMHFWN
jgi:hypothetical protein